MFEDSTLGEILESKAKKNGAKPLVYFKGRVASYEQVNERANRVANWFLSAGFKKGDKVAILLNNCLELMVLPPRVTSQYNNTVTRNHAAISKGRATSWRSSC